MTIDTINNSIEPQKKVLLNHALYSKIQNPEHLHCFLETHVFAVWDFMSLLKGLQAKLTCTTTPWVATENPETRYLINEIVLAEESDLTQDGKHLSHYEMYLDAMQQAGADTSVITQFIAEMQSLHNIFVAIKQSHLHHAVKSFLDFTFRVLEEGKTHQIAAAFTFGRENLIPSMFNEILKNIQDNFPETNISKLIYYFERHIELDQDDHGPMAMQMITELCGTNAKKWQEVEEIAQIALEKRIELWNAIEEIIEMKAEMA